jgi:hypothetical protein
MVTDTSALAAILADEPERRAFKLTDRAAVMWRSLSAASAVELSIVVQTRRVTWSRVPMRVLMGLTALEPRPSPQSWYLWRQWGVMLCVNRTQTLSSINMSSGFS